MSAKSVAVAVRVNVDAALESLLQETSGPELLRRFAELTHRMHESHGSQHDEQRAMRDVLEAEMLRRMSEQ